MKSQSFDEDDRFKDMVKFLVNERNVLEYMENDTRHTSHSHVAVHSLAQNISEPSTGLTLAMENLTSNQENCHKLFR